MLISFDIYWIQINSQISQLYINIYKLKIRMDCLNDEKRT